MSGCAGTTISEDIELAQNTYMIAMPILQIARAAGEIDDATWDIIQLASAAYLRALDDALEAVEAGNTDKAKLYRMIAQRELLTILAEQMKVDEPEPE